MNNRDFSKDNSLSKDEMKMIYRYIGGIGLSDKELQYSTSNREFDEMKQTQLKHTKEYFKYIDTLSSNEANKSFSTMVDKFVETIKSFNNNVENLPMPKSEIIKYISNFKEFTPKTIEWLQNQQGELLYHLYHKLNIKQDLLKSLKPIKNSKAKAKKKSDSVKKVTNDEDKEAIPNDDQLEHKIRLILKTNCPYEMLSEQDKKRYNELRELSKGKNGLNKINESIQTIQTENEFDMEWFNSLISPDNRNVADYLQDNFDMRDKKTFIKELSQDIMKCSGANKYFTDEEISKIYKEIEVASNKDIKANESISNDYFDYFDDQIEQYLIFCDLNDDDISYLFEKYQNDDNQYMYIICYNFDDIISEHMTDKIIKALPKKLTNSVVLDVKYGMCPFPEKFAKMRFELNHYKFLYENVKRIKSDILYSIFNNYSEREICHTISHLKELSDNKYNLKKLLGENVEMEENYYQILRDHFMTDDERAKLSTKFGGDIAFIASKKFDEFIRRLK